MTTPCQAHPPETCRLLLNSAHKDHRDGHGIRRDNFVCCLQLHIAAQLPCLSALSAVRICPSRVPQTRPHFFSPYFTLMNFLYSCWRALESVNKVTYGFQICLVFGLGENKLHEEHLPHRVPHLKYLHDYLFCRSHTIKWLSTSLCYSRAMTPDSKRNKCLPKLLCHPNN